MFMKRAGHRTAGEIAKQQDYQLMRSVFRPAQEQPRRASISRRAERISFIVNGMVNIVPKTAEILKAESPRT